MTADRKQVRRRVLAFTGVWFLVAGLLTALSLVVVVFIASALMLLAGIAAGGLRFVRRFPIREQLQGALASLDAEGRSLGRRVRGLPLRRRLQSAEVRARTVGRAAPGRTRVFLARCAQVYAITAYRLLAVAARVVQAGSKLVPAVSPAIQHPLGRRRQALRLNERGSQLRRHGDPGQAVEQHRVALAIVRDLGDEQAEALTLNNLALALAQGGAESEAVQHLEQALVVLRELGDEKHEARVIANLGIVHRRQGHSEEAVSLLHEALDRLPPDSTAYRKVEEELQRAS